MDGLVASSKELFNVDSSIDEVNCVSRGFVSLWPVSGVDRRAGLNEARLFDEIILCGKLELWLSRGSCSRLDWRRGPPESLRSESGDLGFVGNLLDKYDCEFSTAFWKRLDDLVVSGVSYALRLAGPRGCSAEGCLGLDEDGEPWKYKS
jgi:hypothetical protein